MKFELLREYLALRDQLYELETEIRELKTVRDQVERQVIQDMTTDQVQRVTIAGQTIYVNRELKASIPALPGETKQDKWARVERAFDHAGFGEMIHPFIHPSTVAALIREHEKDDLPLPQELADIVNTYEHFSLRARSTG
jgi:hypothetical protein